MQKSIFNMLRTRKNTMLDIDTIENSSLPFIDCQTLKNKNDNITTDQAKLIILNALNNGKLIVFVNKCDDFKNVYVNLSDVNETKVFKLPDNYRLFNSEYGNYKLKYGKHIFDANVLFILHIAYKYATLVKGFAGNYLRIATNFHQLIISADENKVEFYLNINNMPDGKPLMKDCNDSVINFNIKRDVTLNKIISYCNCYLSKKITL